jgi:hypothetical protein
MKPEFVTDNFLHPEATAMACPHCGEANVHPVVGRVETHETDGYTCPLDTRGDWVAIPFWCEMSCPPFRLVIGFHKGNTFVGTVAP